MATVAVPSSPLVDPQTGIVAPEWRAFFVAFIGALSNETTQRTEAQGTFLLRSGDSTGTIGFHGAAPIGRPMVVGRKNSNPALASLITALAQYGLIRDVTN